MSRRDLFATLLVMLFWGVNFPIGKVAVDQVPPLVFVALRFAVVAVLLVPFARLPRGRWRPLLALSTTLGLAHFSLMFTGLRHADAAVASIITQIQVPFAALLAAIWFGERLERRKFAGMVVAIAGVAVLAGEPRTGTAAWAVGLIVAASLVWAFANILMKQLSGLSGATLNGWMALLAAPQLALCSWLFESDQGAALAAADWRLWGAVAFQALIVVSLCYGIWIDLLARYPVNQIMGFTLLVPITGALSSIVALGEPLTWAFLAGGAITIAGVALIVLGPGRPARARSKPA